MSRLATMNVEIDSSPAHKRARYDFPLNDPHRWTLSRNELILHSIYDSGVRRLPSDSELDPDWGTTHRKTNDKLCSDLPPDDHNAAHKLEQIAVLEASLPENTLQKLSLGELDNLLVQHPTESNLPCNINCFDLLSDEVVLNIFQKLTKAQLGNVSLVCRRFYQLSEDESLWTKMDVSNRTLDKGSMGIILSRQVIILRMTKSTIMYPPILSNVKAALPDFRSRLMYLDMTMCTVSHQSLEIIFQKCIRLKKLSLESVPISDGVLIALSNCKDIEVLNLSMCVGVHQTGLKNLLISCRKIRELNLSWMYLDAPSISVVCNNLSSTIDRFNFAGCRKLLQDEHVAKLIVNCPQLRELDLSDCTAITGDSVRKLTLLEELNCLALSRCYLIPYRSLLYLRRLKNLTYLDVHGSYINSDEFKIIKDGLGSNVNINQFKFSSIARPTVGLKRSSIWNMKVRD